MFTLKIEKSINFLFPKFEQMTALILILMSEINVTFLYFREYYISTSANTLIRAISYVRRVRTGYVQSKIRLAKRVTVVSDVSPELIVTS